MFSSIVLSLSLLLLASAGAADVVVVALPAKGDVTLPLSATNKVELKREGTLTRVRIELEKLAPASSLAPSFVTYVAWALSPEGSIQNIGEIGIDKDKGRLDTTSSFDQLGVFITAEPYYLVDRPSSAVAFRTQAPKNEIRSQNVSIEVGSTDYSSLAFAAAPGVPMHVLESRAAFQVARLVEADRWAEPEFRRARVAMDTMEEMVNRASLFDIVAQSAHEAIRRSQQAVIAAREKKAVAVLEAARNETSLLKEESRTLNQRIQQLTQQQNTAKAQIEKLQGDLAAATSDQQRLAQEKEQLAALEKAASSELADLKARQDELKMRLVLQLHDEFFDITAATLTPAGRDALGRLAGLADAVSGQVRIEGPAPDVLFDAARAYLIQAGVASERIILKR